MVRLRAWIFAVLISLALPAHAETITIVADRWCPYNCGPDDEHPGFMIEIAQRTFAKHGITVEYSILPWTRAIADTREHKYTAIVGAAHDDAPDFIFPQTPQGWMRNMFYVKKGNPWRFSNMKSLEKVSVGAIADYSFNKEMDAYLAAHKNNPKRVQMLSGDDVLDANVKKMLMGRVDTVIEGQYVMFYYLVKQGLANQVEAAGALPSTDNDNLYIAFSPKEPKAQLYADILTRETKAMRKSGELKKILTAYSLSDWQK